jgi:hypothetical protein
MMVFTKSSLEPTLIRNKLSYHEEISSGAELFTSQPRFTNEVEYSCGRSVTTFEPLLSWVGLGDKRGS